MISPTQFLRDQLDKAPEDSKKWKMAIYGLRGSLLFFGMGTVVMVLKPSLAAEMATLVQFTLTAWGGVVAVYLGAQGSVEFKATAALEKTQETRKTVVDVNCIEEGNPKAPEKRPWSALAKDE